MRTGDPLKRLSLILVAALALPSLAACGDAKDVVSTVTGVEFVTVYSAEQKAALRASLSLSIGAITNDTVTLTEAEWEDTYKQSEDLCKYLEDNSREEAIQYLVEGLLKENPTAEDGARQFSEAYVNAVTAQGSFCPGAK